MLRVLRANAVDLAMITDHDSFAGSLEARSIVGRQGLPLIVPVAAEIRTDLGDVIVVFPSEEVPPVSDLKTWRSLRVLAREYGAMVWLPHPYRSHKEIEELAAGADVIEVFNSRCNREENREAIELCARHGKAVAFGSDAHLKREARWFVDYPDGPDPLVVLRADATCPVPVPTRTSDVAVAEAIYGWKRRRPRVVGYQARRFVKHKALELAGRSG